MELYIGKTAKHNITKYVCVRTRGASERASFEYSQIFTFANGQFFIQEIQDFMCFITTHILLMLKIPCLHFMGGGTAPKPLPHQYANVKEIKKSNFVLFGLSVIVAMRQSPVFIHNNGKTWMEGESGGSVVRRRFRNETI